MKRKRRLKREVRAILYVLITIIVVIIFSFIIKKGADDYQELAKQCDQDRGYICDHYQIRQYSLGK